jgi:hypothetical protein
MGRPRHSDAVVVLVLGGTELASWPLVGCGRPDITVVDRLARWQLDARRLGCRIELREACGELTELLDLVGLGEVVTVLREAGRQAEGGEEGGVEEVVMPHDPVA